MVAHQLLIHIDRQVMQREVPEGEVGTGRKVQ
jgi:hypothetical protein